MAFQNIKSTYEKAFKLYKDTYIEMLPIVLLLVMSEYFLNRYFQPIEKLPLNERILAMCLDSFVNAFFLSIVLWGMFQRSHHQNGGYLKMILEGGKRSLAIFASVLIIAAPIIFTFVVMFLLFKDETLTPAILFLSLFVPLMYVIIVGVYFYIAPVLIVNKKYNAIDGLKKSWAMVRNNWMATFQTVFIMVLIMALVQFVFFLLVGVYSQMMASLVTFSMWCALMITHYENLEGINQFTQGSLYGR